MKIVTKTGNLLAVTKGHIVHGCNAMGVMGSGVALAVKNTYPKAFADYRKQYEGPDGLILGEAYASQVSEDLILWNAITQANYGTHKRQVDYEAVARVFEDIQLGVEDYSDVIVPEIHIPMIGAGLGGGNWEIIREIIEQTVTSPVTLWVLQ